MMDLSLEDIEFIKILATSDATILQAGMNEATKKRLDDRVGVILREYYHENTRNTGTEYPFIQGFMVVGCLYLIYLILSSSLWILCWSILGGFGWQFMVKKLK